MLKDITLGQYFPIESPVHHIDPRIKLIASILFIIIIFICSTPFAFAIATIFNFIIIKLSKIKISALVKALKPIIFLIVFTALINLFLTSGNTYIFKWQFIKITYEGLIAALVMSVRIILLVSYTSLLTFTTSPIMLTDGIESLLKPFSKIGVPAHELAMMMTIALRFIPTLLEETDKIIMAQKSRGADFESSNFIKRAKSIVPILVPLFINSFRRADELATAMECRCYQGGKNRTRMKKLKLMPSDYISLCVIIAISIAIIFCGVYKI